jgi:prefoldin subunit 5
MDEEKARRRGLYEDPRIAQLEAQIRDNEEAKAELQQIIDKLFPISNQLETLAPYTSERMQLKAAIRELDKVIHDLEIQKRSWDTLNNLHREEIERIRRKGR